MWIITGLGNPDETHINDRHNVGFMAVDAIADQQAGLVNWQSKFKSQIASIDIGGEKVLLQKPRTYMNLSGEAVLPAASFFKVPPEQIIVIHDELDLRPGQCRIKQGGGHGGHNGLRSIDRHLGKDYWRIRIGIGHPGDKNQVTSYVLKPIDKESRTRIESVLETVAAHIDLMIEKEPASLMNKIALNQKERFDHQDNKEDKE